MMAWFTLGKNGSTYSCFCKRYFLLVELIRELNLILKEDILQHELLKLVKKNTSTRWVFLTIGQDYKEKLMKA